MYCQTIHTHPMPAPDDEEPYHNSPDTYHTENTFEDLPDNIDNLEFSPEEKQHENSFIGNNEGTDQLTEDVPLDVNISDANEDESNLPDNNDTHDFVPTNTDEESLESDHNDDENNGSDDNQYEITLPDDSENHNIGPESTDEESLGSDNKGDENLPDESESDKSLSPDENEEAKPDDDSRLLNGDDESNLEHIPSDKLPEKNDDSELDDDEIGFPADEKLFNRYALFGDP